MRRVFGHLNYSLACVIGNSDLHKSRNRRYKPKHLTDTRSVGIARTGKSMNRLVPPHVHYSLPNCFLCVMRALRECANTTCTRILARVKRDEDDE